jgi:hypothetical protein
LKPDSAQPLVAISKDNVAQQGWLAVEGVKELLEARNALLSQEGSAAR